MLLLLKRICRDSPHITISNEEPKLQAYFNRSDIEVSEYMKDRGDIVITNLVTNHSTIIDFTYADPTAQSVGPYNSCGQAASMAITRKLAEYKHWNVSSNGNRLIIFPVETCGIIGQAAIDFILALDDHKTPQSYLYQSLSLAMHCVRMQAISLTKNSFSSDHHPGNLARTSSRPPRSSPTRASSRHGSLTSSSQHD